VLALRSGAAPEIIDDGRTGFLGANAADLVEAVAKVPMIDRMECRRAVEGHFSAARMAEDHVLLFKRLLAAAPRRVASTSR